jgi:hypothetical protein
MAALPSPPQLDADTVLAPAHAPMVRRMRLIFWAFAFIAGFAQAWDTRHSMNSDGISYLDMSDAYLQGGWKMLINGHWSPLYPWLLAVARSVVKPSSYWEFTVVHLVNFVLFLLAFAAYELMLREFIRVRDSDPDCGDGGVALPEWALRLIAYLVFLWLSLALITIERASPDMLMSVFVYLATTVILKIRDGWNGWRAFALLGLILGFGYIAKTAMFPLALVFLAVALLSTERPMRAIPRLLLAASLFLLVSLPLLAGLSKMTGHFSIGDSGRWTYLTEVNQTGPLWYMQDLGTARGKFQHPPQKIFTFPPVYAFVGPIGGTLPAWYDPFYWSQGVEPRLVLRRQLTAVVKNATLCLDLLFTREAALLAAFLILCVAGRTWATLGAFLRLWPAWVPALAAVCMYLQVLAQERYVAVFFIVMWTALFASVRLFTGAESGKLVAGATFAILFAVGLPLAVATVEDLEHGMRRSRHPQWEIAEHLRIMGVHPGDRVGRIGGAHRIEWARLLRVRVIAEISREDAEYFWSSSPSVRSEVIESFRGVGATAIVAHQIPPAEIFVVPSGWQRIADSDFYVFRLNAPNHVAQP